MKVQGRGRIIGIVEGKLVYLWDRTVVKIQNHYER
jgi:hypothetical protein